MGVKRKTVVNAEAGQLVEIDQLIRAGFYRTLSQFVREAISDKLEQVRRERLSEQVERYCAEGHGEEDDDLIGAQAIVERHKHAKR